MLNGSIFFRLELKRKPKLNLGSGAFHQPATVPHLVPQISCVTGRETNFDWKLESGFLSGVVLHDCLRHTASHEPAG